MSITRQLTPPRRVRRVYGPSVGLRAVLTPISAAAEEVAAAEEAAATILDDFAGANLALSGLSGPTTVAGSLCSTRTGEITTSSTPTPELTTNAGDSGVLLWSDGSAGYAVGVGYVEWTCSDLTDLTQGGESNALRIKLTDLDINTGDPLLNITIEDNNSNSANADIGLSTDLPADLTAWGVGYVDFLLSNFTSGGVDVEDVKRVRLTIKSEVVWILGGEALIQIDEIRRACSGLTAAPGGISSDGAGGPNNGTCP